MAHFDRIFKTGQPHPVGTADHQRVRQAIQRELDALGLAGETQQADVCGTDYTTCARVTNVMTRFKPPGTPAVLLMTHYDSVPAGPGAADDGHGVAALLELARLYSTTEPHRHDLIVLFTDAEETGLLGAQAFVDQHPWVEDARLVVNLEARGTTGESYLFEYIGATAELVRRYGAFAPNPATNSVTRMVYEMLPNNTDLTVFKNRGVSGANLGFVDGVSRYHTPLDNREHLDLGSLQHQGDNAWALVAGSVDTDFEALAESAGETLVFFDLFTWGVFSWSVAAGQWWTVAVCAMFLVCLVLAVRRRLIAGRQLVWGVVCVLCGLLSALLIAFALQWVLSAAQLVPARLPVPAHLGVVASWVLILIFLALLGLASMFGKRTGKWGMWAGAWLFWMICAVTTALWLPDVSWIFVPAVTVAAAGAIIRVCSGNNPSWRNDVAMLVPFGVAGLFHVYLIWATSATMGVSVTSPGIYVSAFFGLLFLPVLAVQAKRVRQKLALFTTGLAVLGIVLVATLPVYTEAKPQHINVIYQQQTAADGAATRHWLVSTFGEPLPESFRQQAAFSADPLPIVPFSRERSRAFHTEATGAPLPDLVLRLENKAKNERGHRVMHYHLFSPRGATNAALSWQDDRIRKITMEGKSATFRKSGDWFGVAYYGMSPQGIRISLEVEGDEPFSLWVADRTYTTPAGLGDKLKQARGKRASPCHRGDTTVVKVECLI